MKILKKILVILLTILLFISIFYIDKTFAFSVTDLTGTQISNTELTSTGNRIITILTTVGAVLSVIVLIILGLKYMMGSVEEKAEYKKTLMPYIIGAAFIFAASTIAGAIYRIAINLGNLGWQKFALNEKIWYNIL